jgi:hypothetical protein
MVTMAAAVDGSAPLLCAVTSTVSCDTQRNCIEGPADAVNLPGAQTPLLFRERRRNR